MHTHTVMSVSSCDTQSCMIPCDRIEQAKQTYYSIKKTLSDPIDVLPSDVNDWLYTFDIYSPSLLSPHVYIWQIWLATSIDRLMPRIGPVVRVI
jgi:hypothetical protein